MKILHVYSQVYEHGDARIVGNKAGLQALHDAIEHALLFEGNVCSEEVLATGGEGYAVKVVLMPASWDDPKWDANPPYYCGRGREPICICDVLNCRNEVDAIGDMWAKTGYWDLCSKHASQARTGAPQPQMKKAAIAREASRGSDGCLPNTPRFDDES